MQLKPEQKKLWRKTFHQERDRGVEPRIAGERADEAVKVWDERGAFDESASYASPLWRIVVDALAKHPDALAAIQNALSARYDVRANDADANALAELRADRDYLRNLMNTIKVDVR